MTSLPPEVEGEYKMRALEADRLAQAGRYKEAIDQLQQLIDNPKLPALDRAMMAINTAILFGKAGGRTQEALAAFEKAESLGGPKAEIFVLENKAAFLAEAGREDESLNIFQSLLRKTSGADKERIEHNIAVLKKSKEDTANPDDVK